MIDSICRDQLEKELRWNFAHEVLNDNDLELVLSVVERVVGDTAIREIQERVRTDLRAESGSSWRDRLDGALGEQIAIAAGSWDLALAAPVDVAEGICSWLDTYFLRSPREDGPREGPEDASPPPCSEGADGLRVGAIYSGKAVRR
jgi:hypothetical protein